MDGNRAVVAASAVGDPRSGVALVRHLKTTKACHYVLMFVTGKGRGDNHYRIQLPFRSPFLLDGVEYSTV